MIVAASLAAGLLLRVLSGRRLSDLAHVRLRGEMFLVAFLAVQVLSPILKSGGLTERIAFGVWMATFPCMILVTWLNRHRPGMGVLGTGLLLNFVVIALNGGMPVSLSAVAATGARPAAHLVAASDFVHVLSVSTTQGGWLADVIPLTGPAWLRSVVSAGDCLLFAGIVVFVAVSGQSPAERKRTK